MSRLTATFTKTFMASSDQAAGPAELRVAADNLFTATLNDDQVAQGANFNPGTTVPVRLRAGLNTLNISVSNIYLPGWPASLNPAGVAWSVLGVPAGPDAPVASGGLRAPTAVAGPDQQVREGDVVRLDASGSHANGLPVAGSSSRSVVAGSSVVTAAIDGMDANTSGNRLSGSVAAQQAGSLAAASFTVDGGSPVVLTSALGLPRPAPLTVPVTMDLPSLSAGLHQVCLTATLRLGSPDTNATTCSSVVVAGGALTYRWRQVSSQGPPVILTSVTSATPSLVAADDGVYGFEVTVTDQAGQSASDRVVVQVGNAVPVLRVSAGDAYAGG